MNIIKTTNTSGVRQTTILNKEVQSRRDAPQTSATTGVHQEKAKRQHSSSIIDGKIRGLISQVITTLQHNLDDLSTEEISEQIVQVMERREGAGRSDILKLLIVGLPTDLAKRMPALLEAIGAQPSTAMVSTTGKESVHRIVTAISHLNAFLVLTDLQNDVSNPNKWL